MNKKRFLDLLYKYLKNIDENSKQNILCKYANYIENEIRLGYDETYIIKNINHPKKIATVYIADDLFNDKSKPKFINIFKILHLMFKQNIKFILYTLLYLIALFIFLALYLCDFCFIFLGLFLIGNSIHLYPIFAKSYIPNVGLNYIEYFPQDIYICLFQVCISLAIISFGILTILFVFSIMNKFLDGFFKFLKKNF